MCTTLQSLLEHIERQGNQGLGIQRYKGLGEMNSDQLKVTPLDPKSRTLLRVDIELRQAPRRKR